MKEKVPQRVKEAYEALSTFVVEGASGQPPIYPLVAMERLWFCRKFLPKEIYTTTKQLRNRGLKNEDIAKLFWGPDAISHLLYLPESACGIKEEYPFDGLNREESREFVDEVVGLLSLQRKEDPYCRDKRNIILSSEKLEEKLKNVEFVDIKQKSEARKISLLNICLFHYILLIQAGARWNSRELHGPYDLENGKLIIKDYFNLKPKEIWPFTSKLPSDKLTIYEVYDKNTKIEIDMFNHYLINPPNRIKFSVNLNGKNSNIDNLNQTFMGTSEEGIKIVRNFDKKDWVKKVIETAYYWMKPAKDILGEDWKPPSEIYALLDRIGEAEHAADEFMKRIKPAVAGLSKKEAKKFVKKVYLSVIYPD